MLKQFNAYQMAKQFYWSCKALKVHRVLHDQLVRASSSIALNLSESSGRRTPQDQRKHFAIAFGSLQECRAILELEKIGDENLHKLADDLAAILYTLSRKKLELKPQQTDQKQLQLQIQPQKTVPTPNSSPPKS